MTDRPVGKYVEYRVKPVTRYIVTKCEWEIHENGYGSASNSVGCAGSEYPNAETAYAVGYALALADHDRLGYPIDDPRIVYPKYPLDPNATAD